MDGAGKLGQGLFDPVVAELVVLAGIEVVLSGVREKRDWKVQAHPQTASVHCCVKQGTGRRGGCSVAVQKLRGTGKVLGQLPVLHERQHVSQLPVASAGEVAGRGEGLRIENLGDVDQPTCQELPRS